MLEPPTTLSTPISGKNSNYFYLNRVVITVQIRIRSHPFVLNRVL